MIRFIYLMILILFHDSDIQDYFHFIIKKLKIYQFKFVWARLKTELSLK